MGIKEKRARQRANKKQHKEGPISTKNKYGQADYTPYTAITGREIMSKTNIKEMRSRVWGSYDK